MLPLKLTLEGLYSYRTRQIVDFEQLTENGLFGIFGAVGSGKSSILEAISFALYAETERMNKTDGRAYNMMNLRSNEAFIELEFLNYENKKYKAQRKFRRNGKRFEDVKLTESVFYEEIDGKWVPLDHVNAEQIIGLSYANFKRTIIIPQGQFKEFLELGSKDRTQMLKEIFNLHRFDLQDKTGELKKINDFALAELSGKLEGFDEVSEEQILINKTSFDEQRTELKTFLEIYNKLNDEFLKLKALKTDFEWLEIKTKEWQTISEKLEQIKEKEQQIQLYEQTERTFKPLLDEENRLDKELSAIEIDYQNELKELDQIKKQLEASQAQQQQLEPSFLQLDTNKQKALDLEWLMKLLDAENEIQALSERIDKGNVFVNESLDKEKELKARIDDSSQQINELKSQKKDTKVLLDVANWFLETKTLKAKLKENETSKTKLTNELLAIEEQQLAFPKADAIQLEKEKLTKEKAELNHQKSHLEVAQKLVQFAEDLQTDEACPLCGSTHHPKKLESKDYQSDYNGLLNKLNLLDEQLVLLDKQITQLSVIKDKKSFYEKQQSEDAASITEIENQIKAHRDVFVWNEFDAENETEFNAYRTKSLTLEQTIAEQEKNLENERVILENQKKDTKKYEEGIKGFKDEVLKLNASKEQFFSQIKILNPKGYEQKDREDVLLEFEKLSQANRNLEQLYKQLTEVINLQIPKLAVKENSVQTLIKRKEKLIVDKTIIQDKLNDLLSSSVLKKIEDVRNILSQSFDLESERRIIQDFYIALETLKSSINSLKEKLSGVDFNQELYEHKKDELEIFSQQKLEKEKSISILENEIKRLSIQFEQKKNLLNERAALEKRGDNLRILKNLFTADGFVQYVSSIYMKQLCDNANLRFHRMTRNQLSLQINDKNDFEIIDYLNEGRTRSVKTLSGGQSFQVSLSLALALAESVQSNALAERNFFFIDEGFGTQDPDSVNLVFETLSNLRNENRIVGIISHVDELKEKMPIALNVEKHEERGSEIKVIMN